MTDLRRLSMAMSDLLRDFESPSKDTLFDKYVFRSRTEARWAVFFDALDLEYQYEPQLFDLGEAGRYLPDFWLPEADKERGCWIEIKGETPPSEAIEKAMRLAQKTNALTLIFTEFPDVMVFSDGPQASGFAIDMIVGNKVARMGSFDRFLPRLFSRDYVEILAAVTEARNYRFDLDGMGVALVLLSRKDNIRDVEKLESILDLHLAIKTISSGVVQAAERAQEEEKQ